MYSYLMMNVITKKKKYLMMNIQTVIKREEESKITITNVLKTGDYNGGQSIIAT